MLDDSTYLLDGHFFPTISSVTTRERRLLKQQVIHPLRVVRSLSPTELPLAQILLESKHIPISC